MALAALFEMYGERRSILEVPEACRKTLVIRCVVGSAAFLMTTEALKLIPLSFFTMIINTSPFLTAILQFFWINERVANYEIVSMVGCYGGIMLLSAPSLFSGQSSAQSTQYTNGIVLTAVSAFFVAVIFVATNKLKAVNYQIITFYLSVTTASVSAVVMLLRFAADGRSPFKNVRPMSWLMMLGASLANYFGVNFMTKSN